MYTFLLILVTIIWGSTFVIIKDTVASVNEYFIVFVRCSMAAVPMLLVQLFRAPKLLFERKAVGRGLVMGFLLAATYASQTIGLKFTSAGHSAFITGSAVVIVPIVLFLGYRELLTLRDAFAIGVTFSGLFLLAYDFGTRVNPGDLITLITVAAYAFHVVLAGRFVRDADAASMIAWQFAGAGIFSLLVFLAAAPGPGTLTMKSMWALVYLGIPGTLFCYFVTVWIQKHVSSVLVALTFSLEPVFAAIFGFIVLGERLDAKELLGAALVLAGVALYQVWRARA